MAKKAKYKSYRCFEYNITDNNADGQTVFLSEKESEEMLHKALDLYIDKPSEFYDDSWVGIFLDNGKEYDINFYTSYLDPIGFTIDAYMIRENNTTDSSKHQRLCCNLRRKK